MEKSNSFAETEVLVDELLEKALEDADKYINASTSNADIPLTVFVDK